MLPENVVLIARWILATVDARVVPDDEGNSDALKYNLLHLLRDGPGYRRYEYAADQDAEIAAWEKPEPTDFDKLLADAAPLSAVLIDVPSGRALSAVVDVPRHGSVRLPVLAPSGYARVEVRTKDGTLFASLDVDAEVVVNNSVTVDLSHVTITES